MIGENDANSDHWSAEADRLLNDDTLRRAVARMRERAMNNLLHCDPAEPGEIYKFQALAMSADRFLIELEAMILEHDDGYGDPLN